MTENEAIIELQQIIDLPYGYEVSDEAAKMAIKALKENEQYKAIGTPTQIYEKIGGLDVELGKYHSIGTSEEFKALKEKIEQIAFILNEKNYHNAEECDYGNYDSCENALRINDIGEIIND